MRLLIPILFFLPSLALSQVFQPNEKEKDPYKSTIEKNIFRAFLSAATDTKYALLGSYEREIFQPFTLVIKGGPAYNRQYDSTDIFGKEQYKWIFNIVGSGEIRYYFNLHRRSKLQKTIKNYTAAYFGLEELVTSKPIYILNKSGNENTAGSNAAFFNFGYQQQFKKTYYHLFFGACLTGATHSTNVNSSNLLHGGIAIGRAF